MLVSGLANPRGRSQSLIAKGVVEGRLEVIKHLTAAADLNARSHWSTVSGQRDWWAAVSV